MKRFLLIFGSILAFAWLSLIPTRRAFGASVIVDPNINTAIASHNGTTYTDVFTSSSTGYAFYRDSNGSCDWSKTTDGGITWVGPKVIDSQTDCLRVAVWYDQWTPGNTTGTMIHVATIDSGSDWIWYSRLNTANDTTSTAMAVSSKETGSFAAGRTLQSITEGTNGKLYAGVYNRNVNFVLQCTTNCSTVSSSWTLAGATSTWGTIADDWMLLLPLTNGNILNLRTSISTGTVISRVWHDASSTWDATSATVDGNCPVNTTYDGEFGAAVNANTDNIYLDYVCNNSTISANTGAIRTQTFFVASSSWSRNADVETSSTLGLTGAKLGLDINTGNVYAVYTGRTTPGTLTTGNVYYKISTSTTMSGWGSRQGPINSTSADIYGARIDGMSNSRLYATWADALNGTVLNGITVATFTPNTIAQRAYRIFQNLNSLQVGTPYGATNATSVVPLAGNPFRLRMLLGVAGTGIDVSGPDFKLQYATTTGTCNVDFSDNLNYVDVTTSTSNVISYYTNSGASNGSALTANAQDPTDGTNVIVNENYVSQNNFSDNIAKIFSGQDGKWDFSLINNTASSTQMFCFRMVYADGTLLNSYSTIPAIQVDSPPTISNVSLNGGQSITLVEGTIQSVVATATVTDANGYPDIFSISGAAYRTSVGSNCTADNNNCYIGTGSNCYVNNCSGNSCVAECDYQFWYFAQPTDSGTPWSGDSWRTMIQASDTVLAGSSATSSGVPLLSLLAFETTSTINYGSFNQGQSMSTLTATSVIRASGNVSMNVKVYGVNMTNGAFSIPMGQQHFATSSVAYGSGATLLANPGSTVAINLPKPTSTAVIQSSTFFWGIAIPSGQMATTYTGGNSFVGVLHSLPWP